MMTAREWMRLIGIAWLVWTIPIATAVAQGNIAPSGVIAQGYINLHYRFIGSAVQATQYNGFHLTGRLRLGFWNDRIRVVYRSHHYIQLSRPEEFIYTEAYRNRHIFHTAYLEIAGLANHHVNVRLGRQYPDVAGVLIHPMDGAWTEVRVGHWQVRAAGGRPIDIWHGAPLSGGVQLCGNVGWTSSRLQWSVGFVHLATEQRTTREIGMQIHWNPRGRVWVFVGGAYDLEIRDRTRVTAQVSVRGARVYVSLMASEWRNPWEQLRVYDEVRTLTYFGRFAETPPSTFRDLRAVVGIRTRQWAVRGSFGYMRGVRSGWIATGWVRSPKWKWFRLELGGQAIRSDYTNFYTVDAALITIVRSVQVRVHTQARVYQWLPSRSGFRYADNFTHIEIEWPVSPRLFMRIRGGVIFRQIGDESFKPLLDTLLLYRF